VNRLARRVNDSGASLLIVLAFVTGVGVVMAALLSYAGTSLGGTSSTKYRNDVSYDADGVVKAGITQIRNSSFQNVDPTTCGKYLNSTDGSSANTVLGMTGANSGRQVAVTCQGGPETGLDAEAVWQNTDNRPGQAVLALATSGTGFSNSHNGDLPVKGKVYINGDINSSPGTLTIQQGALIARGDCSGTITAQAPGTKDCRSSHAEFPDPAYPVPTGSMTYRTAPSTCASGTKIVSFDPGYYDDAGALSSLMNGTSCRASTFWFKPGIYYFDFRNSQASFLPGGGSSDTWTIAAGSDVGIIAGTPNGWNSSSPPNTWTDAMIQASCVSPLDSAANNQGAMFVFGGDSRLQLQKGLMEICGQYYAHKLPIAYYGATDSYASSLGAYNGTATARPDGTDTYTGTDTKFANPTNTSSDTDSGASATATVNPNATGSITLKGLVPTGGIPAHSILTSAKLVVIHRDNVQNGSKPSSITLTVTPSSGSALSPIAIKTYNDAATGGAFHTDDATNVAALDITSSLAQGVYANGLSDLSIKYSVVEGAGDKVVENLDAIKLLLTWDLPTLRPIRSTDSTYHAAIGDLNNAILGTPNNNLHSLYIMGTTYTPTASLSLILNNASTEVFRSGIVAWRAQVDINPSSTYNGPVIEVPDLSLNYSDVYFTGWICPSGVSCSALPSLASGWRKAVTARVKFTDDDPGAVVPGQRQVTVSSWTVYR
jgi:hypothetical protein